MQTLNFLLDNWGTWLLLTVYLMFLPVIMRRVLSTPLPCSCKTKPVISMTFFSFFYPIVIFYMLIYRIVRSCKSRKSNQREAKVLLLKLRIQIRKEELHILMGKVSLHPKEFNMVNDEVVQKVRWLEMHIERLEAELQGL